MPESYTSANEYFARRFGKKTYRLALSSAHTCPNRDRALSKEGCSFCAEGSAHFAKDASDIDKAIDDAKALVANKAGKDCAYIAYFQSYTSTYLPLEKQRELFFAAAQREDICALSIATRPDCIPSFVLEMLKELNRVKPVFIELGLQTSNDRTAKLINRRFTLNSYKDAVKRVTLAGMDVITHVIIGLPGETKEDVKNTVLDAYKAGSRGVKLQLLHILKGTPFYDEYIKGKLPCLELNEYIDILKYVISHIPKDMVVHRLTGDGAKSLLAAPMWSADKKRVLNEIKRCIK